MYHIRKAGRWRLAGSGGGEAQVGAGLIPVGAVMQKSSREMPPGNPWPHPVERSGMSPPNARERVHAQAFRLSICYSIQQQFGL